MLILALGSNIDNRLLFLQHAIELLLENNIIFDCKFSSIYETKALEKEVKNSEKFFNMVISGDTSLQPQKILEEVKKIEKKLGRIDRGVWGPREIDIDIIAIDDLILYEENLIIPHQEMHKRNFVLVPMQEILHDWQHPIYKKNLAEMLENTANSDIMRSNYKLGY